MTCLRWFSGAPQRSDSAVVCIVELSPTWHVASLHWRLLVWWHDHDTSDDDSSCDSDPRTYCCPTRTCCRDFSSTFSMTFASWWRNRKWKLRIFEEIMWRVRTYIGVSVTLSWVLHSGRIVTTDISLDIRFYFPGRKSLLIFPPNTTNSTVSTLRLSEKWGWIRWKLCFFSRCPWQPVWKWNVLAAKDVFTFVPARLNSVFNVNIVTQDRLLRWCHLCCVYNFLNVIKLLRFFFLKKRAN